MPNFNSLRFSILTCYALLLHFETKAQQIESLRFEDLKVLITANDDTLYVVNFWATWCKPCIEELPNFEKCSKSFSDKKVRIYLVNLDFNSQVKSAAEPFVVKKKIESRVLHITDTDPNLWINQIDSSWSGAIPATVFFKNGQKLFFTEKQVSEEQLSKKIIELNK